MDEGSNAQLPSQGSDTAHESHQSNLSPSPPFFFIYIFCRKKVGTEREKVFLSAGLLFLRPNLTLEKSQIPNLLLSAHYSQTLFPKSTEEEKNKVVYQEAQHLKGSVSRVLRWVLLYINRKLSLRTIIASHNILSL